MIENTDETSSMNCISNAWSKLQNEITARNLRCMIRRDAQAPVFSKSVVQGLSSILNINQVRALWLSSVTLWGVSAQNAKNESPTAATYVFIRVVEVPLLYRYIVALHRK